MDISLRRLALVSILLLSTATGNAPALAAQDPDRVALEAAMQRWMTAVNARDMESLRKTMTDDVELLDANAATVTGRDAVIRSLRDVASRGQLVATNVEVTVARDVAWRVVAFTQTRKNGVVHARGQALEIWKRIHGQWRLHRQMAGIIAPTDRLTRPSTREPVLDQPQN